MTIGITFDNIVTMTYSITLTSKGQMTLPVSFRKKLGVKPGEHVLVEMRGNEVIVQKNNWLENLRKIQADNQSYLKTHNIKPLSDEELDIAINTSAEEGATASYRSSLG